MRHGVPGTNNLREVFSFNAVLTDAGTWTRSDKTLLRCRPFIEVMIFYGSIEKEKGCKAAAVYCSDRP